MIDQIQIKTQIIDSIDNLLKVLWVSIARPTFPIYDAENLIKAGLVISEEVKLTKYAC